MDECGHTETSLLPLRIIFIGSPMHLTTLFVLIQYFLITGYWFYQLIEKHFNRPLINFYLEVKNIPLFFSSLEGHI
jgi:hypothetical protein